MPITFARLGTAVLMAIASNNETKRADANSTLALPHQIYTVAIEDVRQGLWRPVGPIATRIIQITEGRATNAYEISAGPDGMPQVSSTITMGPVLQATIDLIERAEQVCGSRSLEFSLLRAPFLNLMVAWLRSDGDGDEDVFLPVVTLSPEKGTPNKTTIRPRSEVLNREEMVQMLKEVAQDMDRLSQEQRGQPPRVRRGD